VEFPTRLKSLEQPHLALKLMNGPTGKFPKT